MELPKWPILFVTGQPVTEEQADHIILRTTTLHALGFGDDPWTRMLHRTFGIKLDPDGYWDYDSAEAVEQELGSLRLPDGRGLQYLSLEDRISSCFTHGPYGWCDWDGTIGAAGIPLNAKWPSVDELDTEWSALAGAFPFLNLTAQICQTVYGEGDEPDQYTPLITWRVRGGRMERWDRPGPLLREPEFPTDDEQMEAFQRPDWGRGVLWHRLDAAVRRVRAAHTA